MGEWLCADEPFCLPCQRWLVTEPIVVGKTRTEDSCCTWWNMYVCVVGGAIGIWFCIPECDDVCFNWVTDGGKWREEFNCCDRRLVMRERRDEKKRGQERGREREWEFGELAFGISAMLAWCVAVPQWCRWEFSVSAVRRMVCASLTILGWLLAVESYYTEGSSYSYHSQNSSQQARE